MPSAAGGWGGGGLTLRDKKVNIQAPCGGPRDPHFMRFQHGPPPRVQAPLSLRCSLSWLRVQKTLRIKDTKKVCMLNMCSERSAAMGLDLRAAFLRLQRATWCREQPCATPHSSCARRPWQMLGEPHNGCHDGPARCRAESDGSKCPCVGPIVACRTPRACCDGALRGDDPRHVSVVDVRAARGTYRCSFWSCVCEVGETTRGGVTSRYLAQMCF